MIKILGTMKSFEITPSNEDPNFYLVQVHLEIGESSKIGVCYLEFISRFDSNYGFSLNSYLNLIEKEIKIVIDKQKTIFAYLSESFSLPSFDVDIKFY